MNILQRTEIDRFISCGEHDNSFEIWSGGTFAARAQSGSAALRGALISEVTSLAGQVSVPEFHESDSEFVGRALVFVPDIFSL